MTAEDTQIDYRPCSHCQGLGEVDPTDVVDENDLTAVIKELRSQTEDGDKYGLDSDQRGLRIRAASRIIWLANRVIWLENCETIHAEDEARYAAMRETAAQSS